jgi:hypothetical protein
MFSRSFAVALAFFSDSDADFLAAVSRSPRATLSSASAAACSRVSVAPLEAASERIFCVSVC